MSLLIKRICFAVVPTFTVLFLCMHCKRDTSVTYLIQNLHPAFTNVVIKVSFKRGINPGSATELWTGTIPSNSSTTLYSKTLSLSPGPVAGDVFCCLRTVLLFNEEILSEDAGDWKKGKNYRRTTISTVNGMASIRNVETTDPPEDLQQFTTIGLP
ncbi:MAG: hypothetical protein K8S54_17040 [Spirochaetia bacterium]|nr:hypothetical protein [Spirochaetia bacterium]